MEKKTYEAIIKYPDGEEYKVYTEQTCIMDVLNYFQNEVYAGKNVIIGKITEINQPEDQPKLSFIF